jgi:hypothetical protein
LTIEIVVVAASSPIWSQSICFESFVRSPKAYVRANPTPIFSWGLAFLVGSAAVAYAMGQLRGRRTPVSVSNFLKRWPRWLGWLLWLPRWAWRQLTYVHPSGSSAWRLLLDAKPASDKHVSIHLSDGSLVRGIVRYYNSDPNENGDREIVLDSPIEYRAPKGKTMVPDYGANFVTIPARQITALFVTYIPKKAT